MKNLFLSGRLLAVMALCVFAIHANAASFRVQCPDATTLHPLMADGSPNPDIKCQQIAGGDGFATMGDGSQIYLFAFGPLSGLTDILNGLPGTENAQTFNTVAPVPPGVGEPTPAVLTADSTNPDYHYNGAVGLMKDPQILNGTNPECAEANPPDYCDPSSPNYGLDGYVDPREIEDVGVLNGSMPAPTFAIDEDDEFFLTLTNVGMIMRPDLFEQHTVHFHGYPNASSFFDGVPEPSVAINIGASMTYYYLSPDAGTYMWHCHITPPEHLQMGMVGQVYVRPRQNKIPAGDSLYQPLLNEVSSIIDPANPTRAQYEAIRKRCIPSDDILCSNPLPMDTTATHGDNVQGAGHPTLYAYNDGDGSTAYDVEYPLQIHGFDPNFHFVGMTFNPEPFTDMKNKYFLINGRSYPDTINDAAIHTQTPDGTEHYSQVIRSLINVPVGGKALLRFSDLDAQEEQTIASLGMKMHVIGQNAKLLRDQAGNNTAYDTNSITMGGGESYDVILDASDTTKYKAGQVFYLYSPNLDHLSNDAENFGGLMTEIHICNAVDPITKACS